MIPTGIDLKGGEYMWFKSRYEENVWRVGVVCTLFDDLDFDYNAFCTFSGDYVDEWDVIEVGPVIHPPEDK